MGQKNEEQHWNWKGENAGYVAIHQWLTKYVGKVGCCEFCHKDRKTEWALKKGFICKRDRTHYFELCVRCHRKYDAHEAWNKGRKFIDKIKCEYCKKEFYPRCKATQFCSNSCRAKGLNSAKNFILN